MSKKEPYALASLNDHSRVGIRIIQLNLKSNTLCKLVEFPNERSLTDIKSHTNYEARKSTNPRYTLNRNTNMVELDSNLIKKDIPNSKSKMKWEGI